MLTRFAFCVAIVFMAPSFCVGQEEAEAKSASLEMLKGTVGVWDAEIEVWPQGPDAESNNFKGVETNRASGDYWIVSEFDSEFMGQTMKVHSIVGYDLDKKKLFGMIVDHGPYSATMTGEYDPDSKTTTWITKTKTPAGEPMIQKTMTTQKSDDLRELVLHVPTEKEDEFKTFMKIKFTKRKAEL